MNGFNILDWSAPIGVGLMFLGLFLAVLISDWVNKAREEAFKRGRNATYYWLMAYRGGTLSKEDYERLYDPEIGIYADPPSRKK